MHLNDQQLIELDETDHAHISECDSCRIKANNLINLRQQLSELPEQEKIPSSWSEVQNIHSKRQQAKQLQQNRKLLNKWRLGSFALAASLLMVLIWPGSEPTIEQINKTQLATLIEQNNLLQLKLGQELNSTASVNLKLIMLDISDIDQAIQRAYLLKMDDTEKLKLWKTRRELIEQLLADKQQPLRI